MIQKLRIALIGSIFAGTVLLVSPTVSWSAENKVPDDASQIVHRMETHWQMLIHEKDPARRKELIAEHRKLMAEAQAVMGATSGMPMGNQGHENMMMGNNHHYDLQNTTEMHTMMLDMMQ